MPINLSKGQKVDLTKGNPGLKSIMVGLGWDVNAFDSGSDFDLDAAAFMLGANGKCPTEKEFIFYGNLKHASESVIHMGDNLTGEGEGDDEQIMIDLSKVPANIERIAFTVTIYDAEARHQNFGQVSNSYIRLVDESNEVELIQIMDEVFHRFGIRVCIKMNNRKILSGIAEIIGEADKIVDITVAIDKLDKIGLDNVNEELRSKGLPEEAIERLQPIIMLQGSNQEKIATLKEVLSASETGLKGVAELDFILERISHTSIRAELELDLTLARGLNYYTGAIFEVKALDVQIGSITGGGRYDNLTGVFGMEGVSGVGFSFGADRIFDVLNQLDLYPEGSLKTTQLLFVNFGQKEEIHLLPLIAKVRKAGIRTELYPESTKMKKQMGYADAKKIPFVAIVGENEMAENKINLKNMLTGEQTLVTIEELIERF